MKVTRVTPNTSSTSVHKTEPKGGVSFSQLMGDKQEEHDQEQLKQMLKEIEKKGKHLAENRTVEVMLEYKEMIKGFIEQAVNFGLKVEERRGLSRSGRSRMMKVVSMIDEKLVELTDMILDQEKPQIKLLEKIGQLQGLLVNLFV